MPSFEKCTCMLEYAIFLYIAWRGAHLDLILLYYQGAVTMQQRNRQQPAGYFNSDTPHAALERNPNLNDIVTSGLWYDALVELSGQRLRFGSGTIANPRYDLPLNLARNFVEARIKRIASRIESIVESGFVESIEWRISADFAPPEGVRNALINHLAPAMAASLASEAKVKLNIGNAIAYDILQAIDEDSVPRALREEPIELTLRKEHVSMVDFPINVIKWFEQYPILLAALKIYPRVGTHTAAVRAFMLRHSGRIKGGEVFGVYMEL